MALKENELATLLQNITLIKIKLQERIPSCCLVTMLIGSYISGLSSLSLASEQITGKGHYNSSCKGLFIRYIGITSIT